jgi:hypothetical protein
MVVEALTASAVGVQQSAGLVRRRVNAADESSGPGPVAVELELGALAVADEFGGDVQQSLAKTPGLGLGELAVKADELHPGKEALGDERATPGPFTSAA